MQLVQKCSLLRFAVSLQQGKCLFYFHDDVTTIGLDGNIVDDGGYELFLLSGYL